MARKELKLIKKWMFLAFFASPCQLLAQMIEIPIKPIKKGEIQLNSEFVNKNKINCLVQNLSNKPDNEVIKDEGLTKTFCFDSLGRLEKFLYTRVAYRLKEEREVSAVYKRGRRVAGAYTREVERLILDTIVSRYVYDEKGKLITERTRYGENYYAWYYYYKDDSLVKRVNTKENNKNYPAPDFVLGVQTIIAEEQFTYQFLGDGQTKVTCLNDEGRPFKTIIKVSNEEGKLIRETHNFLVGGIIQEYLYYYEGNRLVKWRYTSNENGPHSEEVSYKYDTMGNILTEFHYKDAVKTLEYSYLYDENFIWVKSILIRDFVNKSIKIIKHEYH